MRIPQWQGHLDRRTWVFHVSNNLMNMEQHQGAHRIHRTRNTRRSDPHRKRWGCNCNFATVDYNVNIWYAGYLICDPHERVIWPTKGSWPTCWEPLSQRSQNWAFWRGFHQTRHCLARPYNFCNPALGRLRQESGTFKASLGCRVKPLKPVCSELLIGIGPGSPTGWCYHILLVFQAPDIAASLLPWALLWLLLLLDPWLPAWSLPASTYYLCFNYSSFLP